MKIGILIDRLNVGGVEKIAIEQVNALRSIGEDAVLVVLSRKAIVNDAFSDLRQGMPTIYLDDRLPPFLRITFKFPVFNFFSFLHVLYPFLIPFVVKSNEFDYFIVHGTYTSFTAITIRKFRHISFSAFIWDPISYILQRVYSKAFSKHVYQVLLAFALLLDKIIIKNSDVIFVGGDAHNDFFKRISKDKPIKTIYPSVHYSKILPKKKKEYILMATAWKKGKQPEYVLEIVKHLSNFQIIMVGKWLDPLYFKEFKELLKKEHLDKNIIITGGVTEKQLITYYEQALVVLQTNDDRGFGMPALEAAGHGTTFIIPRGQGVCNLFKNTMDGFYTKEKDTKTIVKYINTLLLDKQKALALGKHGWETVKEKYSWKRHAIILSGIVKEYAKK